MRSFDHTFMSRDDAGLAERMDRRSGMLAGLRLENFAAGANLKMSAGIDELEAWRSADGSGLSLAACAAAAASWALRQDPLFAAQFDGRDQLLVPEQARLGVSLDAGDRIRFVVLHAEPDESPAALGARLEKDLAKLRDQTAPAFRFAPSAPVPTRVRRRRWTKMILQETQDRFDYLVPALQARRYKRLAAERGHFQIHNIGALDVQDFKGFLSRPAVAALWVLRTEQQVLPKQGGGYRNSSRLPMVMIYAQELIPLDRACGFMSKLVAALESPAEHLEARP